MDDLRALARAWASLPQFSHVHGSADGAWAFWCGTGTGEVTDVFCAPLTGPGMVEQLTFGTDDVQIRDVSADGQVLILAQSRHGDGHDHLLLLDRRVGNRLHLLTPKQDSHHLAGGSLTRDGKAVIFHADYDYARQQGVDEGLIWQQDLTTGARRCLARLPRFDGAAPSLSPSGQRILLNLCGRAPGSGRIWVMNADGSGLREVFAMGPEDHSRGAWLDDDRIVVITERQGKDELGIFTLSTGATRWLGGEPELCPHEVVVGQGIFACIAHKNSQSRAVLFDASGARPFPNRSARRSLLPRAALPDGAWLAEGYDGAAPHILVRVAPDGTCQRLTPALPSTRRHQAPRDLWWQAEDGQKVQGWLYGASAEARGLIVHVHAGPAGQAEEAVLPEIGFWVQLGYAVLAPNPRGSTGFGQSWRRAIQADGWAGRVQTDIRSGIAAVIDRGLAPGLVAVTGHGFGGYCSWYGLCHFPDLVGAALPRAAPLHPEALLHAQAPPQLRDQVLSTMGGPPQDLPQAYAAANLAPALGQIRGPVLILHGAADHAVPPDDRAERALILAGLPHDAILFETEGHALARRSTQELILIRAAEMLAQAFAPRGQAPPRPG